MTAVTSEPALRSRSGSASPYRLTFAHLVRSEWIKLVSLRSTWWSLGVAAVLSVGLSALIAAVMADADRGAAAAPGFAAVDVILMPTQFTMLVAGILGAIAITGEYSTGMIRSTLTAQPRRGAVIAAKAFVVSLLLAATTVVIYAIAILVTAPLVTTAIDWSAPSQSVIPLALGVFAMVVYALIGLGFGFIVRNGSGAIAATVGVLFVLPIVFGLIALGGEGWQWLVDAAQYLPSRAGNTLASTDDTDKLPALLAMIAWAVVPLGLGWAVLRTRDA